MFGRSIYITTFAAATVAFGLAGSLGCNGAGVHSRTPAEAALFGPAEMRIHPIFTRVKDWTGEGKPDGIDALIEFTDQFGDPTKASGRIIFELYDFQKFDPERRGPRVVNPWVGSIESAEEQRDRWNRTSRTYGFELEYADIDPNRPYVLTAQFQSSGGGRFFDQIVLEPSFGAYGSKELRRAATQPSTQSVPGFGPTSFPSTAPGDQLSSRAATAPTTGPATEPGQRTPAP